MNVAIKMDAKDKVILSMFSANPGVSQDTIARALGMSQPSVAARVRKLRESGALANIAGVDPFKLGLNVARVDVTATNPAKVMDFFVGCPYFMNAYVVSGKSNLTLFLVAARISTLESIVDGHLRRLPEVTDVDFNIVISPAKMVVMPVALDKGEEGCSEKANCERCKSMKTHRCAGCPVSDDISEWFF